MLEHCPDDSVRTAVRALAVESPRALFGNTDTKVNGKFAVNVLSRLLELDAGRRLREVKSKLQRINPIESDAEYRRLFADVLALSSTGAICAKSWSVACEVATDSRRGPGLGR